MTYDDLRAHLDRIGARMASDGEQMVEAIRFLCAENDKRKEEIVELQDAVRSRAIHDVT